MKWYFASRIRHQPKIVEVSKYLEGRGETIMSTWIHAGSLKPYAENLDKVQPFTKEVVNQLLETEIFTMISDPEGTDMFIELGICLAQKSLGKNVRLYIIGNHSKRSLMQLHPDINHVENIKELLEREKIDTANFINPVFEPKD